MEKEAMGETKVNLEENKVMDKKMNGKTIGIIVGAIVGVVVIAVAAILLVGSMGKSIVGSYKFVAFANEAGVSTVEMLEEYGFAATLTLAEDGTGEFVVNGESYPVVFNESVQTVTINGTVANYALSGNQLILTKQQGAGGTGQMQFVRK